MQSIPIKVGSQVHRLTRPRQVVSSGPDSSIHASWARSDRWQTIRRATVAFWIVSIFLGWSGAIGPVDHVRLGDVASVALVTVAAVTVWRRSIVIPISAWLVVAMAVVGIALLPITGDPMLNLVGAVQLIEIGAVIAALYALLMIGSAGERHFYLSIFVAAACVEAIIATLQSLTNTGDADIPSRGIGTLGLSLGYFLSIAGVFAVWRVTVAVGRDRLRWIAATGVLLVGLLSSQTRTSWAGAIAGIGLMLVLSHSRRVLLVALVAVALVFGVSQAARATGVHVGPLERVNSVVDLVRGDTEGSGNWTFTRARAAYWSSSIETIREHPLGIGLKNFRETLPALARERLPERLWFAADVQSPHNQYLWTTVELGPVGALLLLVVVAWSIRLALAYREHQPLALGLVAAVVVQALLTDVLFGPIGLLTAGLLAALEWHARRAPAMSGAWGDREGARRVAADSSSPGRGG